MANSIFAEERIGGRQVRTHTLEAPTTGGWTPIDLTGIEVHLHYKYPGAREWTTISTEDLNSEIAKPSPSSGEMVFSPLRTFYHKTGLWKFYYEVIDVPELAIPNSDLFIIEVKDGKP